MPNLYSPGYLTTRRRRVSRLRLGLDLALVFGLLVMGFADLALGAVAAFVVFVAWLGALALNLRLHG